MRRHNDDTKHEFLEALAKDGRRNAAARAVGVSPSTVSKWLKDDEQFADAFREAQQDLTELLEESALEKAIDGKLEKRFDKDGNLISERYVYSDTLHVLLLKANAPEKYKDRSATEIGNLPGEKFEIADTTAAARLAAILEAARHRMQQSAAPEGDVDPFS